MTKESFHRKLQEIGVNLNDVSKFFNKTLEEEPDSLRYIEHVRAFFNERDIEYGCGNPFNFDLFRTMISVLHTFRTSGGYDPNPVVFHEFMPRPSKEAVSMAEWHSSQRHRDRVFLSEKRRGFYRMGIPTQDCGSDLREYLAFYEHQTKR